MNPQSLAALPFLTAKLHRQIVRNYATNRFLRAHPFTWNREKNRLELVPKQELGSWYFSIIFYAIYVGFFAARTIHVTITVGPKAKQALMLQYMTVLCFFGNIFQMTIFRFDADIAYYLNNSLEYIHAFSEKLTRRHLPVKSFTEVRLLEYFFDLNFFGLCALGTSFGAMALIRPQLPVFVSAAAQNPESWDKFHWRIIGAVVALYAAFVYLKLVFVLLGASIAVLVPLVCSLSTLSSAKYLTHSILMDYKKVEILGTIFNQVYGTTLLPMTETILILLSIYGFVGFVKMSGVLSAGMAVFGTTAYVMILCVFRAMAEACIKSDKMLAAWKRNMLLSKRTLLTIRRLKVMVGSYYFVDTGIILTITHIIAYNSVSLMLVK